MALDMKRIEAGENFLEVRGIALQSLVLPLLSLHNSLLDKDLRDKQKHDKIKVSYMHIEISPFL